jgi:hypothetical protein
MLSPWIHPRDETQRSHRWESLKSCMFIKLRRVKRIPVLWHPMVHHHVTKARHWIWALSNFLLTWRLKAGIVETEERSIAKQRKNCWSWVWRGLSSRRTDWRWTASRKVTWTLTLTLTLTVECSWALQGRLRRDGDLVQLREELAGSSERESAREGPERGKLKYLRC